MTPRVENDCWDYESATIQGITPEGNLDLVLLLSGGQVIEPRGSDRIHNGQSAKIKQEFRDTLKVGDQIFC